jgi:hypothetical protein
MSCIAEESKEKENGEKMCFRGRWSAHTDKLMIFYFIYCYHGGGEKAMMGTGG